MTNPQREIAKQIAHIAHLFCLHEFDNRDQEPLDGDHTEELSVMLREELDYLNGNISEEEYNNLPHNQ